MTISINTTKVLKALLPLIIILHHVSFRTDINGLVLFSNVGVTVVTIFFFLSGYGLFQSLNDKKDYLKKFLKNRLSTLLIPYLISIILYQSFCICVEDTFPLITISSFLNGNTNSILPASWYVIVISIFYFMFWVNFNNKRTLEFQYLTFFITGGVIIIILKLINFPSYWYISLGGLYAGMFHSIIGKHIQKQNNEKLYIVIIALTTLTFYFIPSTFACILFYASLSTFVVLLSELLHLGNLIKVRAIRILSNISYELYLTHVIVYRALRCDLLYIQSDCIYIIFTFIITIIFSYIIMNISKKAKELWILK